MANITRLLSIALVVATASVCYASTGPRDVASLVAGADIIVVGTLTKQKSKVGFTGLLDGKVHILRVERVLYGPSDVKALNFQMYAFIAGEQASIGDSGLWCLTPYTGAAKELKEWREGFPPPKVGVDHRLIAYSIDHNVASDASDRLFAEVLAAVKKRLQSDKKYLEQALLGTGRNLKDLRSEDAKDAQSTKPSAATE